jgi:hypothetical protein
MIIDSPMSPAPWVHFTFGVDRVLSISEMLLTKNWKVLRNNNRLSHVRFTFLSRLLKRMKSDYFLCRFSSVWQRAEEPINRSLILMILSLLWLVEERAYNGSWIFDFWQYFTIQYPTKDRNGEPKISFFPWPLHQNETPCIIYFIFFELLIKFSF